MDETDKERLVERFRDYLESMEEYLPQQAPETPDLFTLLSELTALKNEVKIESRQVKTALDEFRGLFDTLQQANARLDGELGRQREHETRERQDAERDLLLELLELRDRLQAGQDQLRGYRPGWLARRGGAGEYVSGIAAGQAMLLRRLDEILARRGVRALPALEQRFDPRSMHAAETANHPERDDGQVVGEIRTGFFFHGRLLRPAEVIVNKRDSDS